ncbi:hypothetical protein [Tateyamaria sp. SN3-11]|uniref:hypothetical protein n=1 Tax=Tateyamaria sp. SN3-11 TaxID=3092147 RepID=UPI0039EAA5DE
MTDPCVHEAARKRAAKPPVSQSNYWPTTTITEGMEVVRLVTSKEQWAQTGIFLESAKTYKFTANGEWLDKQYKSSPTGFQTRWTSPGHLLSSAVGRLKRVLTGGDEAKTSEAILARRQDQWLWFALIGVVANGIHADREEVAKERDPLPPTHETFLIGDMAASITPEKVVTSTATRTMLGTSTATTEARLHSQLVSTHRSSLGC